MTNNLIFLLFSLSFISLSACSGFAGNNQDNGTSGSGGTRFYSLSALSPANDATNSTLHIGVGPVEIPRLLNRPQIVSRKNKTEIDVAEHHQWGGSYKEELIQVITDNLASLLKTESIEQYPWKFTFKPHYQVRINIERFDGQLGKNIVLKARWRLIRNNKEIRVKRALINTPVSGKSYNDYVKAQSQALATLSKQIAAQISN